jgi:hypothetical protein
VPVGFPNLAVTVPFSPLPLSLFYFPRSLQVKTTDLLWLQLSEPFSSLTSLDLFLAVLGAFAAAFRNKDLLEN